MADTDWDALSTEVYDLLGMGSGGSKGQVWEAWEHAKNTDHDEWHDDCWNFTNDDEMWAYYDEQVEGAEGAYPRIMAAWSKIYNDRKYLTSTGQKGEDWEDNVVEPIRNESYVLQNHTRVKESWYGPSADKYNGALQTQSGAIDEWYQITSTLATSMGTTNDVLKGIMLAVKESFKPVKDKLNGASDDVGFEVTWGGGNYFENVTYGRVQFESLADWLEDLVDSGDWKDTMDDVKMQLEDAKVRTTNFTDGWPKATTGKMEDMDNGHQEQAGGPGDQGTQPTQQPTEQQGPDVDADADPTQGPGAQEQEGYNEGVDSSGDEGDEVNPNEK